MANCRDLMTLMMLLASTLAMANSSVSGPAPTPGPDCSSVLLSMADCLAYVQNGSTDPKPDAECCEGLKAVLQVSPLCLCEVLTDSTSLGIVLNATRAVGLADACNVKAPPVSSMCPGFVSPLPSAPTPSSAVPTPPPREAPVAPPPATPVPTPPSSGENDAPVPLPHQSGADIPSLSSPLLLFLLMGLMVIVSHR